MKQLSMAFVGVSFAYWFLVLFSFFNELGVTLTIGVLATLTFCAFSAVTYVYMMIAIGVIMTSISLGMLWESHK